MGRTLVAWCPDWPLTAAHIPATHPAAIVAAERVVVCSTAARDAGVKVGLRRREAQARCPQLIVLPPDPTRDTRHFDPIVTAITDHVPATEVIRPGLITFDLRGPARAFGGEREVARRISTTIDHAVATTTELTDAPRCRIGIADTRATATLAARNATSASTSLILRPGRDVAFLAPLPVDALLHAVAPTGTSASWEDRTRAEGQTLVELLRRLGIRTLGDLAALPARSVADRFGPVGIRAHRLASGRGDQAVVPVPPKTDRTARIELEEPAAHVETVAFAARRPAEQLVTTLARHALTCTVLEIEAETDHAEQLTRRWRASDGFDPALIVDRVRWQLDGWLSGSAGAPAPTAGIVLVRLTPVEVIEGGQQVSLFGDSSILPPRITQTVTRLQGMLGPDAVLVGVPSGGRDPISWVVGVPWGEQTSTDHLTQPSDRPWPGRLPTPAPATVLRQPVPAEVLDAAGASVGVSGRGAITGTPARVRFDGGPWRTVDGWAGPWPADERWWDATGRRRARFQMTTDDGTAVLLTLEDGRWHLEAIYD